MPMVCESGMNSMSAGCKAFLSRQSAQGSTSRACAHNLRIDKREHLTLWTIQLSLLIAGDTRSYVSDFSYFILVRPSTFSRVAVGFDHYKLLNLVASSTESFPGVCRAAYS
jgi:hypothetical protein